MMIKLFFLILVFVSLIISCQEEQKIETTKKHIKTNNQDTAIIENSIEKAVINLAIKDNVLEIYHPFNANQLIGDSIETNLENTTGAMLSAYSLDKGKYNLFFRVKSNKSWNNWKQLHLNHHVNNPERKVYEATSITNDVTLIQFKSSSSTKSDVVFRLYKFPNN